MTAPITPLVDKEEPDEAGFLVDPVAPVLAPTEQHPEIPELSYIFSVQDAELSGGGESVKVKSIRPIKSFIRGNRAATEKTFLPKYYKGVTEKQRDMICLHFTAGGFRGSLGTLVMDGHIVGVPFMIGRSGVIYEMHPDNVWGNSSTAGARNETTVAIELINHGPLIKLDDGFHRVTDALGPGALYCGLDKPDLVDRIPQRFRGFEYFATHTDAQYESLTKLLKYLTAKYSIPYRFIAAADPRDPNAERYAYGKAPPGTRGIVSHVNFHEKGRIMPDMKGEKWDIGPAFGWDRLTGRSLSLPAPIAAVGGSAAPASGNAARPPDTTKDELKVTQKTLDRYYKHTEGDTANHGGCYPVGTNTLWHGGLHLFVDGVDVHASFDGQIVAARLKTPPLDGTTRPDHYGSGAFLLLRHQMDLSLIQQLDPLLVPVSYSVTQISDAAPGIKFTPDAPLADGKFFFQGGDVLERTDEKDTRTPRSEADQPYPVKIASLHPSVEKVTFFQVIAVKADAPDEPKLTDVPGKPPFSLRPGDQLTVLPVPAQQDLRLRDVKANNSYEVELTRLGPELATTLTYDVSGGWLPAFWKAEACAAAGGTDPSKDDGRLADLFAGDKLELLHAVDGTPTDPIEVKVTALAEGVKDPASVTLTKGMVRPFMVSSAPKADEPIQLSAGDKLTIVQLAARAGTKGKLDLVQIAELAPAPAVPNVGASGSVKSKTLALYQDRSAKKVATTAKQTDTLTVTGANYFPWLKVTAGGTEGWIDYNKGGVVLDLVPRNEAGWAKALIGKSHLVPAFSDADLKAATPASSRALTVGTKGFVDPKSKGLKAGGTFRPDKHGEKRHWKGKIAFDPLCFEPKGKTREEVYGSKASAASKVLGAKGKVTFVADSLAESRDVRTQLNQNVGKTFYSLYMHLDDEVQLTKDKLKSVAWFPREVASLKLKSGTTWQPDSGGEAIPLIEGDKLRPEDPWLTHETPDAMKMFWDDIAEADLVTAIVAKAGKDPAWLYAGSGTSRLMPLAAGDRLVPTQLLALDKYKAKLWVEVRVEKAHDWRARGAPAKRLKLVDDAVPPSSGFLQTTETAEELGASGERSYVRVATRNTVRGWVATKDLGAPTGVVAGAPTTGFIQWNDALFEAEKKKRSAVYAAHKTKPGTMPQGLSALLTPGFAEREEQPSTKLIARLDNAEVVRFPLVPKGSSASTRVHAGDTLWKSGTFAPVLPRDEATGAHGKLIHWEIFSEENLLPSRPFSPNDRALWEKIPWLWWEAVDDDDDWTMNCKAILEMVAKGIPEGDAEKKREELVGEILNPKEIESLYKNTDVAKKLRHAACKFILEWAVDPQTGLTKMKNAELDREWWLNMKQRFGGGPMQDWAQHVDHEWANRQAKYFAPVLWWAAANKPDPKVDNAGMPSTTHVWHYNPIAFLEAFSTIDLAKQAAAAKSP